MSQFSDEDAMNTLMYIINNHPKVVKVIGDAMLTSWARDPDRNVPMHQLTEIMVGMIVNGLERLKFQGPAGPKGDKGSPGQQPSHAEMIEHVETVVRQNHKVLQGPRGDIGPRGPAGPGPDRQTVYNACVELLEGMEDELRGLKGDTGPQGPAPTNEQVLRAVRQVITDFVEKRDERIRGAQGAAGKPGRDGRDGKPGPMGPKGRDGQSAKDWRWKDVLILMLILVVFFMPQVMKRFEPKSSPVVHEVSAPQPSPQTQPQTKPVEPIIASKLTLTLVKLGKSNRLPITESIPSTVYLVEGYFSGEKIFSFRRAGSGWSGEYFRLIEEAVIELKYRDPKSASSLPKTVRLTVEK